MKNSISNRTLASGAGTGAVPGGCGSRCGSRHHRTGHDLQPDGADRVPQPAGRERGLLLGLRLQLARRSGDFAPAAISDATCPTMQVPGPTLIVTEGQTVTVNLTNNLPAAAGNTSILFPGFHVTATGGVHGPADAGGGARRCR